MSTIQEMPVVEVEAKDLPAFCPNPSMPVWCHHPKVFLLQERPAVKGEELIAKINELAHNPPSTLAELATRIQALARIDLRDTGEHVERDVRSEEKR